MMITTAYTLSVTLMILAPIVAAALLRRRVQAPWFLFLIGAATFIGSQVVHLPLNDWLADIGLLPGNNTLEASGISLLQTCIILGLTAGLCEELARAAGYALLRRFRRFEHGLMLGLGHGGIEAMVFGGVLTAATLSSLLPLRDMDLASLGLPAAQLAALTQQLVALDNPWYAAPPLIERLLAITLHVILSMLVWRAFDRRRWGYVALAIVYHAFANAFLLYMAQQWESIWAIYGLLVLILLPGLLWLWRVKRETAIERPSLTPWRVEWTAFIAATRKEFSQLWRVKHVLVVGAVFVLFGMMSPLLAYFTPQILGSIEGAEMFADLIPTPSVADAVGQYIKNLTQFGFLMVILLGMGAIAGEKEKGTAALILSKPLPRWAFVLSKFTAQTALYIAGFLVGMLGAYYYTLFLFGPVDLGAFAFSNLLLLAWLLPFVAITLLGSALTRTLPAAGGVGLAGSVALLLTGYLPKIGPLFPGSLLGWATQVGMGVSDIPIAPQAGALAASGVITLVCVLGALAAFERQEL